MSIHSELQFTKSLEEAIVRPDNQKRLNEVPKSTVFVFDPCLVIFVWSVLRVEERIDRAFSHRLYFLLRQADGDGEKLDFWQIHGLTGFVWSAVSFCLGGHSRQNEWCTIPMVAKHTKSEVHASIHTCIYHASVNRVVQVFLFTLDSHIIGEECIL